VAKKVEVEEVAAEVARKKEEVAAEAAKKKKEAAAEVVKKKKKERHKVKVAEAEDPRKGGPGGSQEKGE
jgi:hypothetical protein